MPLPADPHRHRAAPGRPGRARAGQADAPHMPYFILCALALAACPAAADTRPVPAQRVPAQAAPARPPSAADNGPFDISEIRVDGNTVLPPEQVEEIVYPYLGPARTVQDIVAARKALEEAYTKAGWVTVTVGAPRWADRAAGVVSLAVTERHVGRLRVTHARYFVPSAVRDAAPSVKPGKVPNINDLKRDLLGLNALPDRTVSPSLKPGRRPDTVDIDLDVDDKFPLHATAELNNRYNAFTRSLRVTGSLTYNNFFQRGDSATLTYNAAPADVSNSEITSASYLFHVPSTRLSVLFSYLHSNSNIIALGTTDVAGRGTTAGFRLIVPIGTTTDAAGDTFQHSFSVGWDYKKFYELNTFYSQPITAGALPPGVSVTGSQSAPVTFYPITGTYAASWITPKSETDLTIGAEVNINHLGSNGANFDTKRFSAPPGFSLLRAGIVHQRDLPFGTQFYASVQGQLSNDPLVSSEQFSIGGADTVRGYLEADALGDYGFVVQTELRSPNVGRWVKGPVDSWRFHVFADGGVVGLQKPLLGQRSGNGLESVGVGTRVNLWGYLNGSVQTAQTLNNSPNTKAGTNRVLFRVYGEF